jgi:hypothetical protein
MDDVTPERWLPVVGFEGSYEVSDLGRVRGLHRTVRKGAATITVPSRILAGVPDRHGYLRVCLSRSGKHVTPAVHVLVAVAFIGPCPPGMEVRHGPNGQLDNSLANLSYGTHRKNCEDRRRDGTHREGTRVPQAKLTEVIVRECRDRYASGDASIRALAREFEVSPTTLRRVIHGERWKHVI